MNNIKDISRGQLNTKNLLSEQIGYDRKDIFFINRAKKIVTAIYMITSLMDNDDGIKALIRQKSLDFIQNLFNNLKDTNQKNIKKANHSLYETLSYIEIVFNTGKITEMNYRILSGEIDSFQKDINDSFNKLENTSKNIKLSNLFFSSKEDSFHNENKIDNLEEEIKIIKENVYINDKIESKKSIKAKRHENILDILKQKKNASIKEICLIFKDCSSKTIQRDLKELIKDKKVIKRGDKRWARYDLK